MFNNDEKDLIADMQKSEAWRLISAMNKETIDNLRQMATQQDVKLEDRLWYSALAQGREQALNDIADLIKK